MSLKNCNDLTMDDFKNNPIWEFDYSQERIHGDSLVKPVYDLPVNTMAGRFIGTPVTLSNGSQVFAVINGLGSSMYAPISSFVIHKGDSQFVFRHASILSDAERLAIFLNLTVQEVFPISYDISNYVYGDEVLARGEITAYSPPLPEGMTRKDYFRQILMKKVNAIVIQDSSTVAGSERPL